MKGYATHRRRSGRDGENQFVKMDQNEGLEVVGFPLAIRLRRVFRQPVGCRHRDSPHLNRYRGFQSIIPPEEIQQGFGGFLGNAGERGDFLRSGFFQPGDAAEFLQQDTFFVG